MSGAGAGAVLLSQTPDDVYRRLNDLRATDLYATNIIQPVYDAQPGQLERLPLELLQSTSVTVSAGSINSASLNFPEDGFVQTIIAACGQQPVGSAPGLLALQQVIIHDGQFRYRFAAGTIPDIGRDGQNPIAAYSFASGELFVRAGDVLTATVQNFSAGAALNISVSASFRRLQP